MCGILGVCGRLSNTDAESIVASCCRLCHRGPDAVGSWIAPEGTAAFGHRRLSIIDTSHGSDQPFVSADGKLVLVFNGEIYNYLDLRSELEANGVIFRSQGDTEVLLEAYRYWGDECLQHLNGMWALAIWDRRLGAGRERLFFARDRSGEKPFYFRYQASRFEFASELKGLGSIGGINLGAINHYLALGYIPGSLCLFDGVNKLPPAHAGFFDQESLSIRTWRYWHLPEAAALMVDDPTWLVNESGRLLEDSVRLRLGADVPVGVLLSGGLDSSLIAAAASRVSSHPVQTFTIALPGSRLDEAHHARKVADYLGTQHYVLELETPSIALVDGMASFVDEPIADSSLLPAWMVFGLAHQHVKVALGGDGGDELFGGYTDYTTSLSDLRRLALVPPFILKALSRGIACFPAGVKGRNRIVSLRNGALQQLIWGTPYFDVQLRTRILKKDIADSLCGHIDEPEQFLFSLFNQGITPVDRMSRTHFGSILSDDFLVKVDRASMAHSLEVRAPMLDHRLIEFCFSQVPDDWKVKDGESRRLQRLLAKKWLPPDLDTKRKQGFSIPVNEWLRAEGEVRLMERMESLPDVINLDEVRSLVRGHLAGRANGGRLFALIMLAIAMQNISS